MKWIYGKQNWQTLQSGQASGYLMTDHRGGFSSMTMLGSATRSDHSLLMTCIKAPNHRVNILHRMAERIEIGGETFVISSQEFADGRTEDGYRYLDSFTFEDTPVWRFHVQGISVRKEASLKQGTGTLALRYVLENRDRKACRLVLTPFFQFVRKGAGPGEMKPLTAGEGWVSSNGLRLYYRTNGAVQPVPEKQEWYFYREDARDGRRENGMARACHEIAFTLPPAEKAALEVVYARTPSEAVADAGTVISGVKACRAALERQAGFQSPVARMLSKSADQFIVLRESTGGETILAGYPFFEDWGRDTMIALPGLCIATGRYESARSILRTFAAHEKRGLMPNLFPEGTSQPAYNTADAALLFINCVYLLYEGDKNKTFVREMYPVMVRIMKGYRNGTDYGIHMDDDGLIMAGSGLDQVTWMDVRAGDILPTPRHGKPVEINAYWYNALRVMETLGTVIGMDEKECREYGRLAERVRDAFERKFWMEEKGCLKDLLSGTRADTQIRCNQIWAVSMPFTMLDREKECRIVDTVFEKLYTPCGLRTLEEADADFHPNYAGNMFQRDMAYHQGTVWVFPLGGYYLAYLKVHDSSAAARSVVREQLEVLESALREGCIGQLPEVYDGAVPGCSRGCFAQAWSVAELLRVYEALEKAPPENLESTM